MTPVVGLMTPVIGLITLVIGLITPGIGLRGGPEGWENAACRRDAWRWLLSGRLISFISRALLSDLAFSCR